MYRVELFEHGKWRKCTYDKKNFEFLIGNNLKTKSEIRSFPYKPYFFHRIKWSFIKLWKWIKKTNTKLKHSLSGGFFILIGFIIANIPNYLPKDQHNTQEILDKLNNKDRKIQILQTFSDSLLIEIKQKELIIKEYELAQKDSTLMNDND
jgi:hypothetical protein